jgi:signal transduction histidine kinase
MGTEIEETPVPTESSEPERRAGYLGFVAHEVRNPLSTALWSAELLARMSPEERGAARGEKLTAMCLRSLARVRQLVEDHFLAERLDAGGIPVRVEAVPLAEMIEEVSAKRPQDVGEIRSELGPSLFASVDRALAERALEALVAAAGRDATPVLIGARGSERRVTVSVKGAEVSPEQLSDPQKGSPGDTKGRTLALPAARRAVAAVGGTLSVEGGAFLLTLPRAPAYTPPPPDTAAHS